MHGENICLVLLGVYVVAVVRLIAPALIDEYQREKEEDKITYPD